MIRLYVKTLEEFVWIIFQDRRWVVQILLLLLLLTAGEEAWRQLHKNAVSNFEQVLEATPHKAPTVRLPTTYYENYQS